MLHRRSHSRVKSQTQGDRPVGRVDLGALGSPDHICVALERDQQSLVVVQRCGASIAAEFARDRSHHRLIPAARTPCGIAHRPRRGRAPVHRHRRRCPRNAYQRPGRILRDLGGLDPRRLPRRPGRQPRRRQIQSWIQSTVDTRVDRPGIAVTDNRRVAHHPGGLEHIEQHHPARANGHQHRRQHDRGGLFAVVVFHSCGEASCCRAQPPIVKQVAGILVPVGQTQRHSQ